MDLMFRAFSDCAPLAYVGCIAGAIMIDDYRRGLAEAGFSHVQVVDSGADLNVYGG